MSMFLGFSSNRDKTRRKSCHRRNDSSELDVFDAESYFSSINEGLGHNSNRATTLFHELGIAIRDDCTTNNRQQGWREGRVSLDIPATGYTGSHHYHHHHHHHHYYHRQHSVSHLAQVMTSSMSSGAKETKKHRQQPSSPGGKLASFFNSLISQAISSKKKKSSKLSSSQPDGTIDQEESPSSWRRRKSSNNFSSSNTSTTTTTSTRTRSTTNYTTQSPPYPLNTPTKSYKDLSRLSVSRCKNPSTTQVINKDSTNLDWLDEKFKCIEKKGFDRHRGGSSDKERSWVGRSSTSEESTGVGFKRFAQDDGGESDSSSDLFELQLNYDQCSSGLPVYETTCMDSIKRSSVTPIANVN